MHPHADVTVPTGRRGRDDDRHRHLHHHVGTLPDDPFPSYGRPTALAVGALHGIGAETPTQILLFLAAARAGGTAIGVALLLCFIVGLLASNTVVALTATFGFLRASRNFRDLRHRVGRDGRVQPRGRRPAPHRARAAAAGTDRVTTGGAVRPVR